MRKKTVTKPVEVFVGMKIKTTDKFKPMLADKTRFDPNGEQYTGIVLDVRKGVGGENVIMVDIGEEKPFTHFLGGMLPSPTGVSMGEKEYTVEEEIEIEDEQERNFSLFIRELAVRELSRRPMAIRQHQDAISESKSTIRDLARRIASAEKNLLEKEYELKAEATRAISITTDIETTRKAYTNLMKNKKILSVEVLREDQLFMLVTTNDLTYRREWAGRMIAYNVGAFKILIPLSHGASPGQVRAINYKKHVQKMDYHHPCIHNTSICMGGSFQAEIGKMLSEGNYVNLAHLMINFLEEPNYGTPHIDQVSFSCAQPVIGSPEREEDWFSSSFWSTQHWDGSKYSRDTADAREKYAKRNMTSCVHCHNEYLNKEDACPSCATINPTQSK